MNAVNKNMRAKDDEQTLLTDTGNNVSDKEEAEDKIDNMKKDWLVPMTVRFSREANEVFQELADRNGVSKAQVVRIAAAGGLERYFGNLRYIDREQADAINSNLIILANELSEMKHQIRRIGVNFYQDLKLKYEGKLDRDVEILDMQKLEDIMTNYEQVAQEVSEALWHIQG
ncbi:plasmid transfer protein [Streptococcus dysgalactiae]|uniref:plasmid transfer protein n=1 Tax=Streptococcus dysgalactiae TaxID=1334 RepID=UPI0003B0F788|nr:plasmid transfer protein [Streptococcus dysgalactiae]BAN93870.1 putative plasmid transfer protein [Streptococcus dysgalactiae subsp. equisimilis 167]KKC18268.1 hypothetical protein WH80_08275 [Streptococcus dysgalactiae subsp. equisimilis]OBY97182.1 hypothetical protein BBG03_06540 [Streptococcus dysgalactiae subsp. equisimilis]OBZ05006.1 hypothetical protein BBG04_06060 [Streptococcus dysgalactiae subsp. equisimilis]OCX03822.1 hypothetical protein BBG07_03710 [Streptococcus dysgalactiae su